jgi:hypothetical protein
MDSKRYYRVKKDETVKLPISKIRHFGIFGEFWDFSIQIDVMQITRIEQFVIDGPLALIPPPSGPHRILRVRVAGSHGVR